MDMDRKETETEAKEVTEMQIKVEIHNKIIFTKFEQRNILLTFDNLQARFLGCILKFELTVEICAG